MYLLESILLFCLSLYSAEAEATIEGIQIKTPNNDVFVPFQIDLDILEQAEDTKLEAELRALIFAINTKLDGIYGNGDNLTEAQQSFRDTLVLNLLFKSIANLTGASDSGFDETPTGKLRRKAEIKYLVRNQNKTWEPLQRDGSNANTFIIPNAPVKVLVHGLITKLHLPVEERLNRLRIFDTANALADNGNNVIVMDWTSLASYKLVNYPLGVDNTKYAGEDLAQFLEKLYKNQLISSWENVHFVGYSLGAHTSGIAGNRIFSQYSTRVGRITGLDPAGPLFVINGKFPEDRSNVLDETDANFVDIIHTNMGDLVRGGRFGTKLKSGHADFYPDGGEVQEICTANQDYTNACSHRQSFAYFYRSLSENFIACPCENWMKYQSNECDCTLESGGVMMGESVSRRASGKFFLRMYF